MQVCVHLASSGVQVVAVGGEEQMGEASVVAGGQQGQLGAVLAGVEASAAGVRAAGVNRLAGAEAEAGDNATLALLLHCSQDNSRALIQKVHEKQVPITSTQSRFLAFPTSPILRGETFLTMRTF